MIGPAASKGRDSAPDKKRRLAGARPKKVASAKEGDRRSSARAVRRPAEPVAPAALFSESWYRAQTGLREGSAYQHYLERGISLGFSPSALFDVDYYSARFPDVDFRRFNPVEHYLSLPVGARKSPHALFDSDFYRTHGAALPESTDPFLHYLTHVDGLLRQPHPLFDPVFYLDRNPDLGPEAVNPLLHYVVHGARERRNPHPLFDSDYYAVTCLDTSVCDNPLLHYLQSGAAQDYSPHALFDVGWYLSQTTDPDALQCPVRHYLEKGSAAGLSPHPLFDPRWYRRTQMQPGEESMEPLCHFLSLGEKAGRDPNPLFSTLWYREQYADVAAGSWNALLHYVRCGADEGRDPHPGFSTAEYIRRKPQCMTSRFTPLEHALVGHRYESGRPRARPAALQNGTSRGVASGSQEIADVTEVRPARLRSKDCKDAFPKPLLETVAIMDRLGSRRFLGEGWAGSRGGVLPLCGFSLRRTGPNSKIGIEFKGVAPDSLVTEWLSEGETCDMRRQGLPLTGFAVRVRNRSYESEYSGRFMSGAVVGPLRNGNLCVSPTADDILVGMRVAIVARKPKAAQSEPASHRRLRGRGDA